MSLWVYLDGTDVSGIAIEGSATRRLNRPAQATIKIPMDAAIGGPGSRLKISFDAGATLFFHGMVMDCETDTGEDDGYTVYNASDPMELWQWRPARDGPNSADPGDMSKPTFIEDFVTGPAIMEQLFLASEDVTLIPSKAEGPLFLDFGTFEASSADLTGAPVDWPMTMGQIASLLCSTGTLDIVITPTDPGGGVMGTVDCYKGDYGTDRSGSVLFSYGMGALNVRRIRWNEDMSQMCNKLWYYIGPRVGTSTDPKGDQHWCANVTGTASFPATVIAAGSLTTLLADRVTSQGTYGVRMDVKIWDAQGDCTVPVMGYDLYKRLWVEESWIRQVPRGLIHITPTRGTGIGAFDIGDIVSVEADSSVRGGFSGAQRVFGYTVSWDEDGPFELSELQTSSDSEVPLP